MQIKHSDQRIKQLSGRKTGGSRAIQSHSSLKDKPAGICGCGPGDMAVCVRNVGVRLEQLACHREDSKSLLVGLCLHFFIFY